MSTSKGNSVESMGSEHQVTPVIEHISRYSFEPFTKTSESFKSLERLTVLMYDKSSALDLVNQARITLFSKRNRDLDNIPPTQV